MEYSIIIPGAPIAQARPKFYRRGNGVGTYNPQESEAGRWILEAQPQIQEMIKGPVALRCFFFFARPQFHYGTGRNIGVLKDSAPKHHTKKPDTDNLTKFVKDNLTGRAYHDDAQIVELIAVKAYVACGDSPRTVVTIQEKE